MVLNFTLHTGNDAPNAQNVIVGSQFILSGTLDIDLDNGTITMSPKVTYVDNTGEYPPVEFEAVSVADAVVSFAPLGS